MLTGDLSAYPYQLYDPATTCGYFGNPACAVNESGQPIVTRSPISGNNLANTIGGIDPVSAKLAAYWPSPNITGAGIVNNYTNEGTSVYNGTWDDQYYDPRVDVNVGQRNRIFGKLLRDYNLGHGGAPWPGPSAPGFGTYNLNDGFVLTLGDTHSFSATVVNEFRFSSNRSVGVTYDPGGGGHGFPDIGVASKVGLANVSDRDFPMMNLGGYLSENLGPCCGSYSIFGWLVNQVSDNVSIVRGRNTIKVGGGYGWQQNNWLSPGRPSGQFGFSGILTKNLQSTDPGLGLADFLLGYGNTVTIQPEGFDEGWRMPSAFLFAQDTIKVTPKFTVNVGLRDDIYWSPTEVFNRQANFSPTAINPATGKPGALVFAGVNGTPTRFADTTNNFAPRVGLAYSINSKTVLRASGGMFYAETPVVGWTGWSGLDMDVTGYSAIPFAATTTDQATPAYSFCVPSATRTCALGQQLTAPVPIKTPPLTGDIANGQGVNWIPRHVAAPVTYQWTMGLQRELPHDFFIEANYVGSRGIDLWYDRDINQVPDQDIGPGNMQPLRPYPQYLTLYTELNDGQSRYNALQLSVRRRAAKGLDFSGSYTWSRVLDDSSLDVSEDFGGGSITTNVQDIYNLRAERAVSDRNHAQVASVWAMYEVPSFIPGKVGKAISGGWQLNNILEGNTGPPISVFTSITPWGLSGLIRPNRICNGNLSSHTLQEWFDTSCFTLPAPYSFGNSSRNPLTGPGFFTWDFSLFKNNYFHTKLNEQTNIQIRAEFMNVLNHPCYSSPNATVGSGAAGVINSISVAPRAIDIGFRFIF
jgi:hypothetical protein